VERIAQVAQVDPYGPQDFACIEECPPSSVARPPAQPAWPLARPPSSAARPPSSHPAPEVASFLLVAQPTIMQS
jgi:hypothetical protein